MPSGTIRARTVLGSEPPFFHGVALTGVVFDPRGRIIASISNSSIVLWWAFSGERLRTIRRGPGRRHGGCAAFAPDGGTLLLGGVADLPGLAALDVETGEVHKRWPAVDGVVVAISADGRYAVHRRSEGAAFLHDLEADTEIRRFDDPGRGVQSAVFSHDGSRILSSGGRGDVRLTRTRTGTGVAGTRDPAHMRSEIAPFPVAMTPGSEHLFSGSGPAVRWWTPGTDGGGLVQEIETPGWVRSLAVAPDGRFLAAGCSNGSARLWRIGPSGLTRHAEDVVGAPIVAIAFSPDGRRLVSATEHGGLEFLDTESGAPWTADGTRRAAHGTGVVRVAISPDGRGVASGDAAGVVARWSAGDPAVPARVLEAGAGQPVFDLALDDDGRCAVALGDGRTLLWSADGVLRTLRADGGRMPLVAFAPGGNVWCGDAEALVEVEGGGPGIDAPVRRILRGGGGQELLRAIAPRGGAALRGTRSTLAAIDLRSGEVVGQTMPVTAVIAAAISQHGRFVATADHTGTVMLWEAGHPARYREPGASDGDVRALALSDDGARIAIARDGFDGQIALWDPRTGRTRRLEGHSWDVVDLAFSADGRLLASGSRDRTVRIWEVD